jgi:hypothetical protein
VRYAVRAVLGLLLLGLFLQSVSAAKTDVVVLVNGDEITGEVKGLSQGILRYKTDSMGTLQIEWDDVRSVFADHPLQIELVTGERFYGFLGQPEEARTLRIVAIDQGFTLPMDQVVIIDEIEETFWKQLDGSLSLGFSYTKGTDIAQLTFDHTTRHRARKHSSELTLSAIWTRNTDQPQTQRSDANLSHTRYLKHKWFAQVAVGANQNDELGLDLRLLTTGTAGLKVIQNNRSLFTVSGGLSLNREFVQQGEDTSNIEAVFASRYRLFRYDSPKTDLTANVALYPNLTTWGRYRVEADIKLRKELITDFFWELSTYYSYDSDPPSQTAEKDDYGIVTSFGWSF